jgi:hypothetical protein
VSHHLNEELGLAEDKIAPPFEEEVHKARCLNYIQVCAGAPLLMLHLHPVWDTPQLH